jgi:hypothetical protein
VATLWNLATGDNANKAAIVAAGAITPLVELLRDGSDEGKENAAGALMVLSDGITINIAAILAAGALSQWASSICCKLYNCFVVIASILRKA